ncbi:MAG: PAS domain-containing protein [Saprospiraceae bacterium]|nr:PAS domain-containing protein [Saprospiraceae bacterium]
MVACACGESILFVSPAFKKLTGYESHQFLEGGSRFWFSLIHEQDIPVIKKILSEAHLKLASPDFNHSSIPPLILEYRLKKADGHWIWLKESKWVVEFTADGIKDKVLCFLEDITAVKESEAAQIQELLACEKSSHTLLETAILYQEKKPTKVSHTADFALENGAKLTKREKEVLLLLAEGKSTKSIASQLFVSVNTIETHRRHLLSKFGVKNSVELIAQASSAF